jgi:hypothetical protein
MHPYIDLYVLIFFLQVKPVCTGNDENSEKIEKGLLITKVIQDKELTINSACNQGYTRQGADC